MGHRGGEGEAMKIPKGWRRVTRGVARRGDKDWWVEDEKWHDVDIKSAEDDVVSIGDDAADIVCLIRRIKRKGKP
jgi:hypothetical protein